MPPLHVLKTSALPHRHALALGMVLMLAESAAALAVPALGGQFTSAFLASSAVGLEATTMVLAGLLALFASQAVLRFGTAFVLARTGERIVSSLKSRLYDHLQSLPLSYFQERRQGDTLALLTRDVYEISAYLSHTVVSMAPLLFTVVGAVYLMFRTHPTLAALAVILVPVFFVLLKLVGRRMRPLAAALNEAHVAAISLEEENLGMLPAIKTFTREAQESARHHTRIAHIQALSEQQSRIEAGLGPTVQFIASAGLLVLLWLSSGALVGHKLSPPELVSLLLYAQLLVRPVPGLAEVYGRTQNMRAALTRIASALAAPPEPHGVGHDLGTVQGAITFEGVHFTYPGRAPTLQGVNLHIEPGHTIAIVGPNGAGKSTLAQLLLRLREPDAGRILIDGTDIAGATLESLRRQIGVVPQHALLFNGSVHDNIAYGRHAPTRGQVESAARLARAHDFIAQLPQGYETLIGDHGVRLSGGQQQRLALARALLKDPPILILDEATSMFDPQGELEFLEGARDALAGRTVLLITHRPASLAVADRIVRLSEGRLLSAQREEPSARNCRLEAATSCTNTSNTSHPHQSGTALPLDFAGLSKTASSSP